VWHPNVSSANGAICLDILKNEWSPALTLRTALLSPQALLSCPNADDPQDGVVAGQYKADRALFERTSKFWTETYATPKAKTNLEAKIKTLVGMGFPANRAEEALNKNKGDENLALEWLLTQPPEAAPKKPAAAPASAASAASAASSAAAAASAASAASSSSAAASAGAKPPAQQSTSAAAASSAAAAAPAKAAAVGKSPAAPAKK